MPFWSCPFTEAFGVPWAQMCNLSTRLTDMSPGRARICSWESCFFFSASSQHLSHLIPWESLWGHMRADGLDWVLYLLTTCHVIQEMSISMFYSLRNIMRTKLKYCILFSSCLCYLCSLSSFLSHSMPSAGRHLTAWCPVGLGKWLRSGAAAEMWSRSIWLEE